MIKIAKKVKDMMHLTKKTLQLEKPYGSIKIDSKSHLFLKDMHYMSERNWIPFKRVCEGEYYHSETYKRFIGLNLIETKSDPKYKKRKLVKISSKGKKAVKLMPRLY